MYRNTEKARHTYVFQFGYSIGMFCMAVVTYATATSHISRVNKADAWVN